MILLSSIFMCMCTYVYIYGFYFISQSVSATMCLRSERKRTRYYRTCWSVPFAAMIKASSWYSLKQAALLRIQCSQVVIYQPWEFERDGRVIPIPTPIFKDSLNQAGFFFFFCCLIYSDMSTNAVNCGLGCFCWFLLWR